MTTPGRKPATKSMGQVPLNLGPSSWGGGMGPVASGPPKCPPGMTAGPRGLCRPATTTLGRGRLSR